mgnify:FL=1|jgi:shikimate kinase|tara:strand:- start:1351 stop:1905 length:555 start_codon:yes stop_codon:yes gene_type:complete
MFNISEIKKKNVCIMGLMGSGKSVIGRDLSKYYNLKFYDTDKEIELKTKKSINDIFEEDGELYFREIEEKICLELLTNNDCIISIGGGSIISKKIRQSIKQNSYSIYLHVKLNNLANRVKSSKKRPLLNKNINQKKTLDNLYHERRKFYEKADFIVNNDNDKFEVLEKIKIKLNSYAKKNIYRK